MVCKNENKLSESLTDMQKEKFEKFADAQDELGALCEMDAFVKGFALGVKLMIEAINIDI